MNEKDLERIAAFLNELALADVCEYDPDNESWGNAGDSYSHGAEVTASEIGVEARNVLASLNHASDCARHLAPAYPAGACNCWLSKGIKTKECE